MSEEQEETPSADEGLSIQVGVENGDVIVLFSQKLASFTLPPDSADKMAKALITHAEEARQLANPQGTA